MSHLKHSADQAAVKGLLLEWIKRHVSADALEWVLEKKKKIEERGPDWILFSSFSGAPRYTGKESLNLGPDDLGAASDARKDWNPSQWSVDEAARSLFVLSHPSDSPQGYLALLDKIFDSADVGENVALYQTLPLFPNPQLFVDRASEGTRTNMTSVFEAVAHHNPFPAEYFEENSWNQMVLKCCFVGATLHPVYGLDERANPTLARMLVDYAHERWAASRDVTPELWRPVGPFLDERYLADMERVLSDDRPMQKKAAALALASSSLAGAADLLQKHPGLKAEIDSGKLSWESHYHSYL